MLLGLIMIWMKNLKDLLYVTTYVGQISLGMCILLLVIVKSFKLYKVFVRTTSDDALQESNVQSSVPQIQANKNDNCSKNNSCQMKHAVDELSNKKYLFSTPLIIPMTYFIVCLTVLTIPIIYDINRILYTMIFVATGIPVYFLFLWPNDLPNVVKAINMRIMIICQKIFVALPDEINL